MKIPRRSFVAQAGLALAAAAVPGVFGAEAPESRPPPKPIRPEPTRPPRQDLDTVLAFVRAGHGNLAKVKEMLGQDARLVNAAWDWGGGDWETALGGAAHVGSRECAHHLLSAGARIDAFAAAMLGEREVLASLIKADPVVVTTKGPHGYTLLYHVAISGDVDAAELLRPHLAAEAKDYNQALSAAVRDGHLGMTRWLFAHATINPNVPDALGKRPLTTALDKKFTEVAEELRRHGATES